VAAKFRNAAFAVCAASALKPPCPLAEKRPLPSMAARGAGTKVFDPSEASQKNRSFSLFSSI
jgi:hypothetical protein